MRIVSFLAERREENKTTQKQPNEFCTCMARARVCVCGNILFGLIDSDIYQKCWGNYWIIAYEMVFFPILFTCFVSFMCHMLYGELTNDQERKQPTEKIAVAKWIKKNISKFYSMCKSPHPRTTNNSNWAKSTNSQELIDKKKSLKSNQNACYPEIVTLLLHLALQQFFYDSMLKASTPK